MEVLLRRYAAKSPSSATTEHLDPDELNAFAEGAVPEAARTRYVSHLIECDSCRQVVSQLAISSAKVLAPAAIPAADPTDSPWWKRLAGFFSPMTLRYAAFAMVLIAAAGVVFLVTRRPHESNLVAQNESARQAPESAIKPPAQASVESGSPSQTEANKRGYADNPATLPASSPTSAQAPKLDQLKSGESSASTQKPAKEGDLTTSAPLVAKKAEPGVAELSPSYAPPPPVYAERSEIQTRDQPKTPGVPAGSGPRKSEPADRSKMMDKQVAAAGRDNRSGDDSARLVNQAPVPASRRAGDEKAKGPRRDSENSLALNRNADETRGRSQGIATQTVTTEEKAPEVRSAGGRKFRRQGNSWVDTKFKSSLSVKSIARGSSEFNNLDSGLRAIAQQLSGEVLVVWKGKAYLIR
jgi:hypothetical protein